ncbi:MAG: 6-bladed beta-propeller, partial [Microcystis sp. LE19-196.1B]|nr:6-bladed beta-propeller [Microcystis sp. LE19-196.1B]
MSLAKLINYGGGEKHSLSKALLKSFSLVTATAIGCISIATSATATSFSFAFGSGGSGNGQFSNPFGLAVGSDGNIYVADSANNRVQVFNSRGVFQSAFGSGGRGNGQFATPSGIAVDSGGNI